MKAAERIEAAIARALARGMKLDLGKPIREYRNYEPHVSAPRPRVIGTDQEGKPIRIPGVLTADGRQPRSTVVGYTHDQFAYAVQGLSSKTFNAILWCCGQDLQARAELKWALLEVALERAEREHWPKRFRRADCEITGRMRCEHKYIPDLCMLALWEAAEPKTFGTHGARAKWFGLSEPHWRAALSKIYAPLPAEVMSWLDIGLRHLAKRL